MYDYHVHSAFSDDCFTAMADMVESAVSKGVKELCFTDHIDHIFPDPAARWDFDLDKYAVELAEVRENFKSRITIKKGLELGVRPNLLAGYQELVDTGSFDFVIASVHFCGGKEIYNGDFFRGRTPQESYREYYEELYYCARNFQGFNVIGHLDLLKRHASYAEPQKAELFYDILQELFKDLVQRGKGLEINTSGLRTSFNETLPTLEVMKLYKDLGGEIITLGSDSHYPEHLGWKFPEVCAGLKSIGFKYITTFTNQKPQFTKIP